MYKTDNQKDLLYSTRDYIENLIITCKIKEYEHIYIYIYICIRITLKYT